MEQSEKFFIAENGNLVILYENESGKHIAICEPITDVSYLSLVKSAGRRKGQRTCKKCGKPGHTKRTCPGK